MKEILDATPVALHDREENWIPEQVGNDIKRRVGKIVQRSKSSRLVQRRKKMDSSVANALSE
ncbi:hypothetical protein KAU32_05500 [bacterium]|nr:hypothetical protein [bacterium]